VNEIAGPPVLIAHGRRRRIERAQSVHASPAEDAADRRPAQTQSVSDPPAVVPQPAESQNVFI
jgi:hypothetical protein